MMMLYRGAVLSLLGAAALIVPGFAEEPPVAVATRTSLLGDGPTATGVSTPSALLSALSVPSGFTVDISKREEIRNFYNALFHVSNGADMAWTGNYETGNAGDISAEFRELALLRINFLRAIAGVPADVQLRADYNAKSQLAAMMMSFNDRLDHFPEPADFDLWTEGGAEAAQNSNLYLGTHSLDPITSAINGYIADYGDNNLIVGHRRWLLHPQTKLMGIGHVPGAAMFGLGQANVVWVIGQDVGAPRPAVRDGFIAWPPPGNMPYQLVYPRWSFSHTTANFDNATVSLSVNGQPVNVTIESRNPDPGENTIVWVPEGWANLENAPVPSADTTWEVSIENVKFGAQTTNFTYQVTIFDPAKAGPDTVLPTLTGTTEPFVGRPNVYEVTQPAGTTGYDIRMFQKTDLAFVDDAEDAPSTFDVTLSQSLDIVTGRYKVSGNKSYRLGHFASETEDPTDAFLELKPLVLPREGAQLTFNARHAVARPVQVAKVQVSVDEGRSWKDLFSQPGLGTVVGELLFTERRIDLSAYVGTPIRLRFAYVLDFSSGTISFNLATPEGTAGWFIDDIALSNVDELTNFTTAAAPSGTSIELTPPALGQQGVQVRAKLYNDYPLEWGPIFTVQGVPAPEPKAATITAIRATGATEVTLDFAAELQTGVTLQVQSAASLAGPWQVEATAIEAAQAAGAFSARITTGGAATRFFRVRAF